MSAAPLRIVLLDHFYEQDIEALREAAGSSLRLRVVPYYRLRNAANKIFPESVAGGLAPYTLPELAPERARYADRLRQEVGRLYREWPFDVFVLPSDTFYYVRELPPACHALGVPVIVVQKETTITEDTFEQFAPDVEAHAPYVADYMTVCSERHKRFWVVAGADPDTIEVTGQPRFDLYARRQAQPRWADVGLDDAPRTVVFLSYETTAYLEAEYAGLDWGVLRAETEAALFEAVAQGWRVVVKLHPQQRHDEEAERLRRAAPRFGHDVVLARPATDTRRLLLLADAVVGFQSTALLEALVLPKPVAYAGWGGLHDRVAEGLIPFESIPSLLKIASSADDLAAWLAASQEPPSEEALWERRRFVEELLGPLDGHAAERALLAIDRLAEEWRERSTQSERRRRLDRLVLPSAVASLGRGAVVLPALRALGAAGGAVGWERVAAGGQVRRRTERDRFSAARSVIASRRAG